jgi:hypothetical protein
VVVSHQRRIEWLQSNLDALAAEFEVSSGGRWQVDGAIVVPNALAVSFLPGISLPVLTPEEVVSYAVRGAEQHAH